MSSKLDEILFEGECTGYTCRHETVDKHYFIGDEAKQQVKYLFKALIGEDESHIDKSFGSERKIVTKPQEYRNELRAELRAKVDEL